jgi:hypothetical protein
MTYIQKLQNKNSLYENATISASGGQVMCNRLSFLDTNAYAYVDRFANSPSAATLSAINTFFTTLKADTTYSAFDEFYLLGGQDEQATRINLINPTVSLQVVSAPVFVANSGWQGDGIDDSLDSPILLSEGGKFTQDNAHLGVWSLTNTFNAAYYDIGTGATTNARRLNCSNTAIQCLGNLSSATNVTGVVTNSLGHYVITRSNSTSSTVYKNGSSIGVGADTTAATTDGALTILRSRATFSARRLMAAHRGRNLTAGEVTTLYNALNAYKTAIGA